mmetsp:Transcript_31734/g.75407  ORF Transcript_31734/g.75407 Transcript_31734/m.75407 type:complete len:223 (-) Transcript_31734:866-1534(-)
MLRSPTTPWASTMSTSSTIGARTARTRWSSLPCLSRSCSRRCSPNASKTCRRCQCRSSKQAALSLRSAPSTSNRSCTCCKRRIPRRSSCKRNSRGCFPSSRTSISRQDNSSPRPSRTFAARAEASGGTRTAISSTSMILAAPRCKKSSSGFTTGGWLSACSSINMSTFAATCWKSQTGSPSRATSRSMCGERSLTRRSRHQHRHQRQHRGSATGESYIPNSA